MRRLAARTPKLLLLHTQCDDAGAGSLDVEAGSLSGLELPLCQQDESLGGCQPRRGERFEFTGLALLHSRRHCFKRDLPTRGNPRLFGCHRIQARTFCCLRKPPRQVCLPRCRQRGAAIIADRNVL